MANSTHTTYCPRCDRPYIGQGATPEAAKTASEKLASAHMDGQHTDMDNPWRLDDGGI
jgi:hypothetical protein